MGRCRVGCSQWEGGNTTSATYPPSKTAEAVGPRTGENVALGQSYWVKVEAINLCRSVPMPQRRDLRHPRRGPSAKSSDQAHGKPSKSPWAWLRLPRIPWRSPELWSRLRLFSLAAIGALSVIITLDLVWQTDRGGTSREQLNAATMAEKPQRAITVLVIGSDADTLQAASNGSAPAGQANGDAMFLVRVNLDGPLQILNLPVDLAVMLPGRSEPQRLGDLYRQGGIALTADVLRELLKLRAMAPDRYVVVPRRALRQIVSDLGGLEVNPPRTMRYEDKSQKLKIDLQSGLQRLDGVNVEHLVRFKDQWLGEAGRRKNQELVIASLWEAMEQPETLARLPGLIEAVEGQVKTNLSLAETLSLLAAGLDDTGPVQFNRLPLEPIKESHGGLRQLSPNNDGPLWKAP